MYKILLFIIAGAFVTNQIHAQEKNVTHVEKKIDSLLQTYGQAGGPGVAVSVVKDQKIIYSKQTGLANLEYNIPITDSTVFHIASISKQFTAFAILLLEADKKLSIEDDIKKYLPELNELPYKVTIRQLANHTHGFANTYELAQLVGINADEVMSQKQMVNILLKQKQLNFEPGSTYQYNNSGFTLLAEIVERVSGKSFADFTKERIFQPLHMKNTLFLDDRATIVKNKAYSYEATEKGYHNVPFYYTLVGASGLNTTPHDLSLWTMNFISPVVGNQAIFDKMKGQSKLNSGHQIPYALGQETKSYKGLDVIFHGGGDAGYRAYLLRIPAHSFSVVVMGNFKSFNPLNLSYSIVDLYLEKFLIKPKKEILPIYTNKELKKWEGDYEIFPGSFFSLVAKADTLYYQPFNSKDVYPLPVAGKNEFSFPYIPHSKLVFGNNGLYWHFSDFSYLCKKVSLNLPDKATINLERYVGAYFNKELQTYYHFTVKENALVATHSLNNDIVLHTLALDEFYSEQPFFGRIKFINNKEKKIAGFSLSGQNLTNIYFEKAK